VKDVSVVANVSIETLFSLNTFVTLYIYQNTQSIDGSIKVSITCLLSILIHLIHLSFILQIFVP
jgi:hypothetical protein